MSEPAADRSDLRAELRRLFRGRVVLMGIGNPLRGDDAVGSLLARRLRESLPAPGSGRVTVLDAEEIPESWLGPAVAARPDAVLLIDAVELGATPGSVVLLPAAELAGQAHCTHRTPLRPLADYLAVETGAEVALLGVQPGPGRWGEELGPELAAAVDQLLLLLTELLDGAAAAAPAPEAIAC